MVVLNVLSREGEDNEGIEGNISRTLSKENISIMAGEMDSKDSVAYRKGRGSVAVDSTRSCQTRELRPTIFRATILIILLGAVDERAL